ELAVTDPLTGLHNRRYLDNHFAALFDEAAARGRQVSVLLLDIDRFKAINDSYGHDAGDEVLREFAKRVRAHTRGIDLLARYGGEEIVVAVPDTALEGAEAVAERIRERIEATVFPIHRGTRAVPVTVSIGVAARQLEDRAAGEMLKRADLALYRAKQEGRNKVIAAAA
ncbi:MAG TPA: diguanylate cyclase, partial [Beijerinckiaceae bacterium]|nr:diguanylate cyclase [Beijerinckiaceae bacterium]